MNRDRDRCSKGFAHRQGRRRASGHASVDGEPGSRGRFSSRTGNLDFHEPLVSGSHFPQCSCVQFTEAFGKVAFQREGGLVLRSILPDLVRTWNPEHYFNEQLL